MLCLQANVVELLTSIGVEFNIFFILLKNGIARMKIESNKFPCDLHN